MIMKSYWLGTGAILYELELKCLVKPRSRAAAGFIAVKDRIERSIFGDVCSIAQRDAGRD